MARQGYGGDGDSLQGVSSDSGPGTEVNESRCYEDVSISNVVAHDIGPFPVIAVGYPGAPLRRITLRDITVRHTTASSLEESAIPEDFNDGGYPGPGMFDGSHLPAHGLFARHVDDLVVENFRSIAAEGDPRELFFADEAADIQHG